MSYIEQEIRQAFKAYYQEDIRIVRVEAIQDGKDPDQAERGFFREYYSQFKKAWQIDNQMIFA